MARFKCFYLTNGNTWNNEFFRLEICILPVRKRIFDSPENFTDFGISSESILNPVSKY